MKIYRVILGAVVVVIFVLFVIFDFAGNPFSVSLELIFFILALIVYPVFCWVIDRRSPRVTGWVKNIFDGWNDGEKIAIVEFVYDEVLFEIEQTFISREVPAIDSQLTVIVDVKSIFDSHVDDFDWIEVFQNTIVILLICGTMLYFKHKV